MSDPANVARDELCETLLDDFLDESFRLIQRLNESFLQLDDRIRSRDEDRGEACGEQSLNEMFRAVHSLKGLSAMLGLHDINNLTHQIESVFDAARSGQLTIDASLAELMLQAVDRLAGLVELLDDPDAQQVDCGPVLRGIQQMLEAGGVERKQPCQADAERSPAEATAATESASSGKQAEQTPARSAGGSRPGRGRRAEAGNRPAAPQLRMVPIGLLFACCERVVRDVTRANRKSVRLVTRGAKTELDRRVLGRLAAPLIHVVRNAADHGIELPAVRQSGGKPPEGTIRLSARHHGNSIVIQVIDDGKGLDPDQIARKAVEKGIVAQVEAERMTPQEIRRLIWKPGLSTAEQVSEVSGRGMGMDIVKSTIEELNGTVDLDSRPGQGTTITIEIPLAL